MNDADDISESERALEGRADALLARWGASPGGALRDHLPEGYRYERTLASGGMSELLLATDHIGRKVVLKTLKADVDAPLNTLVTEALALARLQRSRHVVFIIDVETSAAHPPFICMEYVAGDTLEQIKEQFVGAPLKTAALGAQLADGLGRAHAKNIVHRDVKPENIIIRKDETGAFVLDEEGRYVPVLIDFGLAKLTDQAGRTVHGDQKGTPLYMSPEQWERRAADVTAASDIYSLGVTLFHLLTGEFPPRGLPADYGRDTRTGNIRTARSVNKRVDRYFSRIVDKCLERDPRHRYQNGVALRDELLKYLRGEPLSVGADGPVRLLRRVVRRHGKTLFWAIAVLAVLFVGLRVANSRAAQREAQAERRENEQLRISARVEAQSFRNDLAHVAEVIAKPTRDPALLPALLAALRDWNAERAAHAGATPAELAQLPTRARVQALINDLPRDLGNDRSLDNSQILDAVGTMVARWPEKPRQPIIGYPLGKRDYFRGAAEHVGREGENAAHISLAYESRADLQIKVTIAVPLFAGGELVGVVAGSTTTSPRQDRQDPDQMILQIAPYQPSADEIATGRLPARPYVVMVHPGLSRGATSAPFDGAGLAMIGLRVPGHELDAPDDAHPPRSLPVFYDALGDPTSTYRWRTAAAPIGKTGFIAVVRRRLK